MSYLIIDSFKLGMDRRKARIGGSAGALWDGINGHINSGGDFERRKKFIPKYILPAGTFGLAQIHKQLYVFGQGTNPGVPAGIVYQQLAHPSGVAMDSIIDVTSFSGKIYAVAEFINGDIYHYYNGARVTTWDTVAAAIADNTYVAAGLSSRIDLDPRYIASISGLVVTIIAAIAGTAFTISRTVTGTGTITLATPQANVAAVPETKATFSMTIQSGTPSNTVDPYLNSIRTLHDTNSLSLISAPVPWAVSNNYTAQAVANAINNQMNALALVNIIGYTASASGAVVTVSAPAGDGTSANGLHISSRTTGNFSWLSPNGTITNTGASEVDCGASSGGVNAIAAVSQVSTATVGGTFAGSNTYKLTIDGVDYAITGTSAGMGTTALTYQGKVYSVSSSLLEFCALNDPPTWGSGTGSGFINIANNDADNDALVGIQQYQNRIAIFSRDNIQIWILAVDPSQNTFQQSVQNTGALSVRSILQYGNIDVFYLNYSGVRSIRARDSSNAPFVNDVGVAIDPLIKTTLKSLTGKQISRACAVIEPLDGRYWLALHNLIFVYSFFSGSKISAWTYYDLTDEIGNNDISEMVRAGDRVYLRSGNTIYLFGGDDDATYPGNNEVIATVSIPFLSAGKPATIKGIKSFDVGLSGTWEASLLPLPADDAVKIKIGTYNKPTYSVEENPIEQPVALFAVEMICRTAGPATITNMAVHFDIEDES